MSSTRGYAHPVGLLLFNRPTYARQVLESLSIQTNPIDQSRMVIVVDGFKGSKPHATGKLDKTKSVLELAKTYFPEADMISFDINLGIAAAIDLLEQRLLTKSSGKFVTIFEEDFVPAPNYLRDMESALNSLTNDSVAIVSLTGDCLGAENTEIDEFVPMNHLWAFSIRSQMPQRYRQLFVKYLGLLEQQRYWKRDSLSIAKEFANEGIFLQGSSQDWVKRAALEQLSLMAVTSNFSVGIHVGEFGENYSSRRFRELGNTLSRRSHHEYEPDFESMWEKLEEEKYWRQHDLMRAVQKVDFFWGGLIRAKGASDRIDELSLLDWILIPIKKAWRWFLRFYRAL